MDLSMHCCLIFLLSFGNLAQSTSVTVNQTAPAYEEEEAEMMMTFTPTSGESLVFLSWFKSNKNGTAVGGNILTNVSGNPVGNDRYNLSGDGSLIIVSAERPDKGYYMCRVFTSLATNIEGFSKFDVSYIDIPAVSPNDTCVSEGSNTTFSCPLPEGFPKPITITWIKGGDVLDVSNSTKYPQSNTTLEIFGVGKNDAGYYKCRAENKDFIGNKGKMSNNTGKLSLPSTVEPVAITFTVCGGIPLLIGGIVIACDWLLDKRIWIGISIVFGVFLLFGGIILFVFAVDVAAIIVLSLGCTYMLFAVGSVLCVKYGIFEKLKDTLKEKEWFKNVDFRVMLAYAFLAAGVSHIIVGAIYVEKTTDSSYC